ncbi:MAG: hypothetical protein PGN25_11695 [Methylorubrum populi]
MKRLMTPIRSTMDVFGDIHCGICGISEMESKPDLVEQSVAFARELRECAGHRQGRAVDKAFIDGLDERE